MITLKTGSYKTEDMLALISALKVALVDIKSPVCYSGKANCDACSRGLACKDITSFLAFAEVALAEKRYGRYTK